MQSAQYSQKYCYYVKSYYRKSFFSLPLVRAKHLHGIERKEVMTVYTQPEVGQ